MTTRLIACLLLVLSACATVASEERILVAGDSVLAWNRGGVARALAAETGARVTNRAVSGAFVGFPDRGGLFARFGIGAQVPDGPQDWVVVNGGANDLATLCGCRSCDATTDRLIARDGGSGALPSLWRSIRERTGARVLIVGYYEGASAAPTRFSGCYDALAALDARAARFAAATDWARFVDAGDVVTGEMLARDRIHPSPEGSAAIARLVADAIGR